MKLTKLFLAFFSVVAIGGFSTMAHSTTQSAMAGHGWPNMFDTCYSSSFAMMINNCTGTVGTTRLLVVPVELAHSGTNSTSAHAGGNGSNGATNCQALAIDQNGFGFSFSSIVSTTSSSTSQLLTLGNVNAAAAGTLHYECNVAQGGGRVINVEFH